MSDNTELDIFDDYEKIDDVYYIHHGRRLFAEGYNVYKVIDEVHHEIQLNKINKAHGWFATRDGAMKFLEEDRKICQQILSS